MNERSTTPEAAAQAPSRHEARALSRRNVLGAGAAGAALLGMHGRAQARAQHATPGGGHAARTHVHYGDLRLLVNRITQGYTAAVWQTAQALDYQGFLEQQLDPASIDDSAMDAQLSAYTTLTMTSKQLWDTYAISNQYSIVINELKWAAILRSVYSKRQLLERMVEFWTDHFNIDQADGELRILKTADDREVIRTHALGNFTDLLTASMHSGAMLVYLDNFSSKKEAPNENYARELLELHTLGVGNYTEFDIKEVARCLTGWSRWPTSDQNYGNFRYVPNWHDLAAKSVLGQTIPSGGNESDGLTVHSILIHHPATAQFLARKMSRWLLAYDPPQALVDEVAAKYTATGGDIKAMIRVILRPANVALVNTALHPKLKRPFHLLASTLRAAGVQSSQPSQLVSQLVLLGHVPFAWQTPDGYPDAAEAWGSALLPRWSFVSRLCANQVPGNLVDVAALFGDTPKSQLGAKVSQILSGGALDPLDVAEIQAYANSFANLNDTLRREMLALGASCPSFQYY